jgi:hypothetical protein
VGTIRILDLAEQFRIELEGRFAGDVVAEAAQQWQQALSEPNPRRLTVDISQLSGYDVEGSDLLRRMYSHGAYLSARNARALIFLDEIASHKVHGPTLVYKSEDEVKRKGDSKAVLKPLTRAAGAGK